MRRLLTSIALCSLLVSAADWPTQSGSPQRDGWAKSETAFTRENVKGLELLYQYKADKQAALTTPMVVGRLITYLGFKEMLVFGGSGDNVYSVDADLNRLIWKTRLPTQGTASNTCGGLTAPVAMAGSSTAIVARAAVRPPLGATPRPVPAAPVRRPNRGGEFFAVGSDGYLHVLNPSTGEDRAPAVKFLPANARVSALNVSDNVIYAATIENCGGVPDALYAIDLAADDRKVVTQDGQGARIAGNAGTAIGTDGTVYAQAANTHGSRSDGVYAVAPKTLEIKDYFQIDRQTDPHGTGITPVVFAWKGNDLIAAAGLDGRFYLLDSKSPGGSDHKTPLFATEPIAPGGFHDSFASWEDPETKERWIYASSAGSIVGFKVEDRNERPVLTIGWTSGAMVSPGAPTIANGIVFALSKDALHALDSSTGKELYSHAVTASAGTGLAIANRRIYFSGVDNSVYCFGFTAEQPQLSGK